MTEATETIARCECGALEIGIHGEPVVQLVCHCEDCRAFSGTQYLEAAFFKPDECSFKGQTISTTMAGGTGQDKTNHSCAACKTPLYITVAVLNGACAVMANRLSNFTFQPEAHIWTSQKADEVTIPAGITQTPGRPPEAMVETMLSSFWDTK